MCDFPRIDVHSGFERERAGGGLWPVLGKLLEVQFGFGGDRSADCRGEIYCAGVEPVAARPAVSSLTMAVGPGTSESGKWQEVRVRFSSDREVPFPFQGRELSLEIPQGLPGLQVGANERVLAVGPGGPLWLYRVSSGVKHFRTAFDLSLVGAHRSLMAVLNPRRFLGLLPLMHWLREITSPDAFLNPPLRAGFIFDDPNLHWPSYGYVDYRRIAACARAHHFHVCFATIPLDAWFVHGPTAEIFRQNPGQISLAVHGNNHTKRELARPYSLVCRDGLLRQAQERIGQLERRSGVSVPRIMIPPHGACSAEMLAAIPEHGFEAVCVSAGSLRSHNPGKAWAAELGYLPGERVAGCPVLPRWGISTNVFNTVLLAAYLGQAIILRAHHGDLKNAPELLEGCAGLINGLGEVQWKSTAGLSRMNYQWKEDGDTLWLRPFGNRVEVVLPPGLRQIAIAPDSRFPARSWQMTPSHSPTREIPVGQAIALHGHNGQVISLQDTTLLKSSLVSYRQSFAPLATIRRVLTEGRDRILA